MDGGPFSFLFPKLYNFYLGQFPLTTATFVFLMVVLFFLGIWNALPPFSLSLWVTIPLGLSVFLNKKWHSTCPSLAGVILDSLFFPVKMVGRLFRLVGERVLFSSPLFWRFSNFSGFDCRLPNKSGVIRNQHCPPSPFFWLDGHEIPCTFFFFLSLEYDVGKGFSWGKVHLFFLFFFTKKVLKVFPYEKWLIR